MKSWETLVLVDPVEVLSKRFTLWCHGSPGRRTRHRWRRPRAAARSASWPSEPRPRAARPAALHTVVRAGPPPRVVDPQGASGQAGSGAIGAASLPRRPAPLSPGPAPLRPGHARASPPRPPRTLRRAHGSSPNGAERGPRRRRRGAVAGHHPVQPLGPDASHGRAQGPGLQVARDDGQHRAPGAGQRSPSRAGQDRAPPRGRAGRPSGPGPGLTVATLTPDGPARAFWALSTTRSSCQASMASGSAPTAATGPPPPGRPTDRATSAMAATSLTTPVAASACTRLTTSTGPRALQGLFDLARAARPGRRARPGPPPRTRLGPTTPRRCARRGR